MQPTSYLARQYEAIAWSEKQLEVHRNNRRGLVKQLVGYHYSGQGAKIQLPINLIEMAVVIIMSHLAAHMPRAAINPRHAPGIRPLTDLLEMDVDHILLEIDYEDTMRTVLLDAILSVGVTMTCVDDELQTEVGGVLHDYGQPCVTAMDLDDLIFDMGAMKWYEQDYMGHRYQVPYEWLRSSDLFQHTDKLVPIGEELKTDSKTRDIGKTQKGRPQADIKDYAELIDLWIPEEHKIVTIPGEQSQMANSKPLREVDFYGPETGPYDMLSFHKVPSNLLPLAPAAVWRDIHDLANKLMRKQGRQAERQKNVVGYEPASAQDAERMQEADDGDWRKVKHAQGIKGVESGGVSPTSQAYTMWLLEKFSYVAGNMDVLGGLAPQAQTLGQEELLAGNAGARINDMRDRMYKHQSEVLRKIAWYRVYDESALRQLTYQFQNTDIQLPIMFSPSDLEGDFLDLHIDIQPYSMQRETPPQRLEKGMAVLDRVMPLLPLAIQQGWDFDFGALIAFLTKNAQLEDLRELFTRIGPPQPQGAPTGGGGHERTMAPNTTRTEIRRNVSGATPQGKDQDMMRLLMATGGQGGA